MTLYVVFLGLTLASYWALSSILRKYLWKEWSGEFTSTSSLIKSVVVQQFRTLSPQNAVAQGLIDFELKHKNLRASLLMICFSKLGVLLIGLLLALSLEWPVFFGVLVLATAVLALTYKNPSRLIQVFFLATTFFWVFQGAFFSASQFIFSPANQDLALNLGDARLPQLLTFLILSLIVTLFGRLEFWSVLVSSVLFFAGALPITTAFVMILGESVAWCVYWYLAAHDSSQVSKALFKEKLLLVIAAAFGFMSVLLTWRSWGVLNIRIFGSLLDKKITFLSLWALWEITVMVLYSIWGHFRARSGILEKFDLEPIRFPPRLLGATWWGYKGWIHEQVQFRRELIQSKVQRLEGHMGSLNAQEKLKFPPGFLDKTQKEVEALKRLLGSIPSDSV